MDVKYEWVISSMQEYPKTADDLVDVVFNVHYRRNATTEVDGKSYFADTYSVVSVPAPSPENFTPYEDLTFEQVCGWLEEILNVEAMDASLVTQLENQINPPVVSLPLPWLKSPVVPEVPEEAVEESVELLPESD
jgi:hypothetical protein